MKPPRTILLAALTLACVATHSVDAHRLTTAAAPTPADARRCPDEAPRRLSVASYLGRLPAAPMTVGFDVDDTALFSTPAFLYARARLTPPMPPQTGAPEEQVRAWQRWAASLDAERDALFARVTAARPESLTPAERAQAERFWKDVTAGDRFSPPKVAVRAIVRHHLERGDRVIFVTARPPTTGETLDAKLRSDFGQEGTAVEFTALQSKVEVLRRHGVRIYYGDSDSDMDEAALAGAWGVRVLRSRYSSNPARTSVGERGECFVLEDSDL